MWFHCTKFLRDSELTLAYAIILSSAVISQVSFGSLVDFGAAMCSYEGNDSACLLLNLEAQHCLHQ